MHFQPFLFNYPTEEGNGFSWLVVLVFRPPALQRSLPKLLVFSFSSLCELVFPSLAFSLSRRANHFLPWKYFAASLSSLSLSLSFHVLLSILYLSSFFFSLAFSFTFSLQKSQCSSGSRAYSSAISSFLLEFFIFIFSKEEVISIWTSRLGE